MFDNRYEVVLADVEAARRIHYQIRYQVYCLEEGFETAANFPDGAERDEWDDHSVHFLVRSRETQEWIAAMRMVLPRQSGLPVENQCSISSSASLLMSDGNIAEISRMCITGAYRRNRQARPDANPGVVSLNAHRNPLDNSYIQTKVSTPKRSEVMMGLLRAAAAYSYENDILNWYFLTTPALARMINLLNIQLIKVGDACTHRGTRYPFLINIRQAESQAKQGCTKIADMLNRKNAYQLFSELTHCVSPHPVEKSLVA